MNAHCRHVTSLCLSAFLALPLAVGFSAAASDARTTNTWFHTTEQSLMDAIAAGNAEPWNRVMDEQCVVTTEEGEVRTKAAFLKELRPLPRGLTGSIAVKELKVDEFPTFAIVRYLADEWEVVFGQRLTAKYRVTDTFRRDKSTWKMRTSSFPMAGHFTSSSVTGDYSAAPIQPH